MAAFLQNGFQSSVPPWCSSPSSSSSKPYTKHHLSPNLTFCLVFYTRSWKTSTRYPNLIWRSWTLPGHVESLSCFLSIMCLYSTILYTRVHAFKSLNSVTFQGKVTAFLFLPLFLSFQDEKKTELLHFHFRISPLFLLQFHLTLKVADTAQKSISCIYILSS